MTLRQSFIETFLARSMASALVGTGVWLGVPVLAEHLQLSVSEPARVILTLAAIITCWIAAARATAFATDFLDVPTDNQVPPKKSGDRLLPGNLAAALKRKNETADSADDED
jgi:hypothetical protein